MTKDRFSRVLSVGASPLGTDFATDLGGGSVLAEVARYVKRDFLTLVGG